MATQTAQLSSDSLVDPQATGLTRSGATRLDAIDMLRGLVIVFMVLDHVRHFFHDAASSFDPTDPAQSYPLLYATRWITHLCAPTFVFLAGVSIFLQKANGKADADLSRFLLTRGAWLVLLEVTLVSFGFNFGVNFVFLQVIWAIGMAMICMAGIARFSPRVVLAIGAGILFLYPLLVSATAGTGGIAGTLLMLAFGAGFVPGAPIFVAYAVVPWLAVMCLGFGLGPVFRLSEGERTRILLPIAAVMLAAFFLLRFLNGYGDPAPWEAQKTATQSAMAFFNITKYPPSPDYVLATLGLSLLVFLALQRLGGWFGRILLDFGRTPLFTYICHLYIAHGLMLAAAIAVGRTDDAVRVLEQAFAGDTFPGWGWSLGVTYAVWLLVIVLLIPLARWMADLKRRRRDWWLGYI
jgi:uncharacterized membrane protein